MVARALAILHTCIYDAWAAYDPVAMGTRLGDDLRQPASERTLANKTKAISFAAYRALSDLFPAEIALFTQLLTGLGYAPADTAMDTMTRSGIGNLAAQTGAYSSDGGESLAVEKSLLVSSASAVDVACLQVQQTA
jgi:hypothetical protein